MIPLEGKFIGVLIYMHKQQNTKTIYGFSAAAVSNAKIDIHTFQCCINVLVHRNIVASIKLYIMCMLCLSECSNKNTMN